MMTSSFPRYRLPLGLPAYWGNETSGRLPAAVMAYFAHGSGHGQPLTPDQVALLRAYLIYYISAPCWRGGEQIAVLRAQIALATTEEAIDAFIEACLEIGLDPL